ncbi:hypothetical protein [Streptomyces xiaopingdaonensis]|uniref:hypothetical protein n=1 Tax=Streptomyces xiaopingdaonensis TaxID=1565415 RepID=UPI000301FFEE|nr:hypothetical protein [Streptomyces xiaopingdaonensis]
MSSLVAAPPLLLAALALVSAATTVTCAWLRSRTRVAVAREHTRRVALALAGSEPAARAAIVHVCARPEAAAHAGDDTS